MSLTLASAQTALRARHHPGAKHSSRYASIHDAEGGLAQIVHTELVACSSVCQPVARSAFFRTFRALSLSQELLDVPVAPCNLVLHVPNRHGLGVFQSAGDDAARAGNGNADVNLAKTGGPLGHSSASRGLHVVPPDRLLRPACSHYP